MSRAWTHLVVLALLAVLAVAVPAPARADAPGLHVHPLEYRDSLTPGHVKAGYVEVSNPGDGPVTIETAVRGFRQTGTEGLLQFYDDPHLSAGIKVDLPSFDLGPREAIRVGFNVDPARLPAGGVYAAIFFRTVPPAMGTGSSYVAESANVGTLLELTNGPPGPPQGDIAAIHIPFWQLGSGLNGSLDYHNNDRSSHPVGLHPVLAVQVLPWGQTPKLDTGLVLPGVTRTFQIRRHGSYLGLLPLTVTDQNTHRSVTRWLFACTGWYQWIVLVLLLALAAVVLLKPKDPRATVRSLLRLLKSRLRRRRKTLIKRPIDGLARKK